MVRHRGRVVGAALAVAFLAVACGSGDPPGGDGGQAAPTSTAAGSGGASGCSVPDDGGLESILALVPDTPDNRELVQVADLEAFLADQGKQLPGDFREIEWVDQVALFTPIELLQNAIARADETDDPLADELGIGLGQVNQGVTAGQPPEVTEVLVGSFDPAAVAAAVDADPYWGSRKETVEADGQTYYAWGGDGEVQAEGRTPIRTLGIGGRLWVDDDVAAFTRTTATMESFLAGCAGSEPTLAADADYAGIAERLDPFEGAFNVIFTDQVREPGDTGAPTGSRGSAAPADDAPTLEGVVAYGFANGPSDDEDQGRMRLVLATGSDAQAIASADAFVTRVDTGTSAMTRRPWADLLTVESAEADGSFVVVELLADNASVLERDLFTRDSLIISEP